MLEVILWIIAALLVLMFLDVILGVLMALAVLAYYLLILGIGVAVIAGIVGTVVYFAVAAPQVFALFAAATALIGGSIYWDSTPEARRKVTRTIAEFRSRLRLFIHNGLSRARKAFK